MDAPEVESTSATRKMSGLRKAAILIVSLDSESASKIMSVLDKETIEAITYEIATLRDIKSSVQNEIVEEFYKLGVARNFVEKDGFSFAQEVLERSLGSDEAKSILDQVSLSLKSTPFAFLRKAPIDALSPFLGDEHPQTIALVLAHLLPKKASDLLGCLPAAKQIEVISRIATMEQTSPDVIMEVEKGLEKQLSAILNQEFDQAGGAPAVAEILNYVDRNTEKAILESLEAEDPDLVDEVRKLMFIFDDLSRIDQKGTQEILKEVQNDILAIALKGASDPMKEKFFAAMSERASELVKENMEYMGPIKLSEVEKAQQEIVDVARRLGDEGVIRIGERGVEEAVIE